MVLKDRTLWTGDGIPADFISLGIIQRIKCGQVLYKLIINLFNDS